MKVVRWILKNAKHLILPVILLALVLWYILPVHFLRGLNPEKVKTIDLFDGHTGYQMDVTDPKLISEIVENVQNRSFQKIKGRAGLSFVEMRYRFRMVFLDEKGNEMARLILESEDTVRKDPFYYKTGAGDLCYELLWRLIREKFHYSY
ncbi:MAG: hypothetical protein IK141_05975 [Clostridia bacterium]|nr:hypothetical protein [Clostridia bacterium]